MTNISMFFWRKSLVFLFALSMFFYIARSCDADKIEKNLSNKNFAPTADLNAPQNQTEPRETSASNLRNNSAQQSPHFHGNSSYVIKGQRHDVLKQAVNYSKIGVASWYGTKFHGRFTAMHERYNLHGLTAASPNLPLPSYAKVTNLENGRQVVVKINDRGPFLHNRILDLSYAAAQKLNFVRQGFTKVKVETVAPQVWRAKSMERDNFPIFAANALHDSRSTPPSLYPFLSGNSAAYPIFASNAENASLKISAA